MQALRVPTANGIHDIKLIGENEQERLFIKQLAEAGTLSCISKEVSDDVLFRPISVTPEISKVVTKATIAKYDFTLFQNAYKDFELRFDSDTAPLDLSLFEAIKLQIKHSKSANAVIELTVGAGLTITSTTKNVLLVTITNEQASKLTYDVYYYDVLMVKATIKKYYLEGKITIKKTATR
ncbi:hypothetical protein [Flavobacterium sp. 14A]|uniref:hypothetical protein n=1 Tax=Flavobacterium sp. 14A TaxID=2735896 RepID=UPI00156F867E|nr:hypothetical protein [Flavobacterium sp. 14A]NRT11531.1 hypothetical protein [Flavobacterium sp. 14A]